MITEPTLARRGDSGMTRARPWCSARVAFFVAAIVTHSHGDRTGGIPALTRRGIPVAALDLTIDKLRGTVERVPRILLTTTAPVHPDPLGFEAFYPGAGHAADNIVVWF